MKYKIHPEDKIREQLTSYMRKIHPDAFFYNRLDQANMSQARRNRMYCEGMLSGLPDFAIETPVGDYTGLWIELKADGKGPFSWMPRKKCYRIDNEDSLGLRTEEAAHMINQAARLDQGACCGKAAYFAEGLSQAIEVVDMYMSDRIDAYNRNKLIYKTYQFVYQFKNEMPVHRSVPFNPIDGKDRRSEIERDSIFHI